MSEKKYKCIENDEIFTESELRKQYEQFKKETNETYYPETFGEYMNAALSKNGSLEKLASDEEIKSLRKSTANKISNKTGIDYDKVMKILRKLNVHGNWTSWEIENRIPDIDELVEIVEEYE